MSVDPTDPPKTSARPAAAEFTTVIPEEIVASVVSVMQAEMALVAQLMGLGAVVVAQHPPQSEADIEAGFDNMPL